MSKFGDLINGTVTVETVEAPVEPVAEPVVDTAPSSVEDPVDPEPIDLSSLSKDELEDYGRTIGIELDRRHSKTKLVKQLEDHIEYLKTV
mgnify:FL=1|jgi:hypothetical protein|tara:strand:- start:559 stop:828 length:270 start_codon:yes stop_codon:yes gene_type:complete